MTAWDGLLLGLVQGLTEFLPISSSGHLAMARALFGLPPDLPYEVFIHGATLIAIVVYFRRRVWALAAGRSPRYLGKIALSVAPAVIATLAFREWIERSFAAMEWVAPTLAISGTLLLSLYLVPRERWSGAGGDAPVGDSGAGLGAPAGDTEPSWATAWWMGCAQAVAILPGISRSGSTIVTGIWLGMTPAASAEFSFLMGIPAILGALVLEAPAMGSVAAHGGVATYALGAVAAFVSGIVAIHLVFRLLASREFRWFGYYCWAVALAFGAWLWLQ